MRIKTGIFQEKYIFSTKKDWPKTTRFQAGGGDIDNIGKEVFFEAFLKDYHVRGVGSNIILAENEAWNKYLVYERCDHSFERMSDDSNIGICIKCKLKKTGQFSKISKCICCGLVGASHYVNSKIYCYEDYKKKVNSLINDNSDSDSISSLKKSLWIYEKLEKLNLLNDLNDEEINSAYYDYKSGYFEYMILACQIYWDKYKRSSYPFHYVDIYDKIEAIKDIYAGMFEVYLIENKGIVPVESIRIYKEKMELFIITEVS